MKDIKLKDVEMPEDLLSSIRTDVFWTNRQVRRRFASTLEVHRPSPPPPNDM